MSTRGHDGEGTVRQCRIVDCAITGPISVIPSKVFCLGPEKHLISHSSQTWRIHFPSFVPKSLFMLSAFLAQLFSLPASSFLHQCFRGAAYWFTVIPPWDNPLCLSPTLGSRSSVITSAGSRTQRRSSRRSSTSPAIPTINSSSMWRMKPHWMTLLMPWAIASSLWKVC